MKITQKINDVEYIVKISADCETRFYIDIVKITDGSEKNVASLQHHDDAINDCEPFPSYHQPAKHEWKKAATWWNDANVSDEEFTVLTTALDASIEEMRDQANKEREENWGKEKREQVSKPTGNNLEDMVHSARQKWVSGGYPSGSHLDYLGDDYDDL